MNYDTSGAALDGTDWAILGRLQEDGRATLAELGRQVGMSAPAVAERVRRLHERGVITGYRAVVDPAAVGLGMTAVIQVTTTPKTFPKVVQLAQDLPEIVECHRATGSGCFILRARVRDVAHLETVLDRIMPFGEPETSVVLSTAVQDKPLSPPQTWSH